LNSLFPGSLICTFLVEVDILAPEIESEKRGRDGEREGCRKGVREEEESRVTSHLAASFTRVHASAADSQHRRRI
jgi:hypothetical protein